ncbi:MAG: hypothetical protein WC091_04645 [Sulfuricellaceae bacterium]
MNAVATLDEIGRLLAGQSADTLRVATVPGDIGIALGTQAGEVLLSRYMPSILKLQPTASRGCKSCLIMASGATIKFTMQR